MRQKKTVSLILLALLILITTLPFTRANPSGLIIWSGEYQLTFDPTCTYEDPETHKNITEIYDDFDGMPSITATKDNKIWVVWQTDQTNNFEIFYKIYGSGWSNDTQLTNDPNSDFAPSIVQTSDGKIWGFWSNNRTGNNEIFYKTSVNNGASWSADMPLTNDTRQDINGAVTEANGKIWVVWTRSVTTTNDELFYKTFDGSAWSPETQLTNNTNVDTIPAIMQANDGKIWVFWQRFVPDAKGGHFQIFYKTFDGSSWSNDTQLTFDTDKENQNPTAFQARDGTIWLFWALKVQSPSAAFDLWFKTSVNNGATWSASNQFTTDPAEDIYPAAAQAKDKSIWIVWTSTRPDPVYNIDNIDLYYKTTLLGDITGPSGVPDGSIDIYDLAAIARAAGTDPIHFPTGTGWNEWNPNADLNADNVVNVFDLFIAGKNYGRTA